MEYSIHSPPGICKGGEEPVFRFEDLVLDVQLYIISTFLETRDLQSLALVSSYIRSLASPALYSTVRLTHDTKNIDSNWPHIVTSPSTKATTAAQHAFREHILSNSEDARHVRCLAWQLGLPGGPCGHVYAELFPTLINVKKIHLTDGHPTHICELNMQVPLLFPRLEEVTLSGVTSLSFVRPLLHSPHRLTSISLDAINPHSVNLDILRWMTTADLSNLKTISLWASCRQPWTDVRESELFSAWKDVLLAVLNTVEHVNLGFKNQLLVKRGTYGPSSQMFCQEVLPLFKAKWPFLQTLRLKGIELDQEDKSAGYQLACQMIRSGDHGI